MTDTEYRRLEQLILEKFESTERRMTAVEKGMADLGTEVHAATEFRSKVSAWTAVFAFLGRLLIGLAALVVAVTGLLALIHNT